MDEQRTVDGRLDGVDDVEDVVLGDGVDDDPRGVVDVEELESVERPGGAAGGDEHEQRERFVVALAGAEHVRHVLGGVVHIVDVALQRSAVEVVVLGVLAGVLFADQWERRAFEGRAGDVAVGGGAVADHDRALLEDGPSDRARGVPERPAQGRDCGVLDEGVDRVRAGLRDHRRLHPVGDDVAVVAGQRRQRLRLDLYLAAPLPYLADQSDDLVGLYFGERPDAGLLEGGAVDCPGPVTQFEHRRTARLADALDDALDGDRLAHRLRQRRHVHSVDVFGLVGVLDDVGLGVFGTFGFCLPGPDRARLAVGTPARRGADSLGVVALLGHVVGRRLVG